MIIMRESDGVHFLYNGEGCVRISPLSIADYAAARDPDSTPKWHHEYGDLPEKEHVIMRSFMNNSRQKVMTIPGYGRYQVIDRGSFRDSVS
jgi:hypothetical protein